MTRKIKINSIEPPNFNSKNFIGFPTTYPDQLYGIIPVKEYLHSINYLNSNTRREYNSSVLKYIIFYIICGLIPGIIAYFVELRKSTLYKNQFEKDLKFSIQEINKSFFDRRIVLSYEIKKTLFVRKMEVSLKLKIPDDGTIDIPISNKTLSPENNEIIVLDTNNQNRDIEYKRSNIYKKDPKDTNFTFIKIECIKKKKDFENFYGFFTNYQTELFNYLTETEFKNMVFEINQELFKIKFNSSIKSFYNAALFLSIFVFGLFLIIPATIIYNNSKIKYFNKLYNELDRKCKEFTDGYGSRGISIDYQIYNNGWNPQTSIIDLIIYFPKDIKNIPTLTKLSSSNSNLNDLLVVEPMIDNSFSPIFLNQQICIQNYNVNSLSPLLPSLNVKLNV